MSISTTIKSIQDIMRKDVGVDGDAQRIGQLVWLLFLKIFDDREQEWELLDDNYRGADWVPAWGDVTGIPSASVSYRWEYSLDGSEWTIIAGASSSTYDIPASMAGVLLRATARATKRLPRSRHASPH